MTGYSGEILAKSVEIYLNGCELNKVLSLMVDNVSSNDVGIQYLNRWLMYGNSMILKREYIHTHYCAHILNLIVKEGLKEIHDSIFRIRAAVKNVRSFPVRWQRFKVLLNMLKEIDDSI